MTDSTTNNEKNNDKDQSTTLTAMAWNRFKKNKVAIVSLVLIVLFSVISILAPFISPYDRDEIDLFNIEGEPNEDHILGTDELGRDVLTRLLWGGRVSLSVGVLATVMQLVIGVLLGAVAGYYGGWIDTLIMRLVDIIMCFPYFVIAIAMAAILGPSLINLIIIIGILNWTKIARIVRAEILTLKEREFIEAAKALGLNSVEIITKHLLPNILAPITVYATLAVAQGILMEAALSFLGMGVKQPQPSWGNILASAQSLRILSYEWWMWVPAGLLVFLTVISINFLGDGLRDALDPKLKI